MKRPVGQTSRPGLQRKLLGARGEEAAAAYLERSGYSILERNYRSRAGEIDIIAGDGADIVFVEVKTRKSRRFGSGAEAVGQRKQTALVRLAAEYLGKNRLGGVNCRFDVIVMGEDFRIDHIRNAFDSRGSYSY